MKQLKMSRTQELRDFGESKEFVLGEIWMARMLPESGFYEPEVTKTRYRRVKENMSRSVRCLNGRCC